MAALPPKDPRRPPPQPLRPSVGNRATSPMALARKREEERVNRIVNPPRQSPMQPASEQYAAARRRLQELDDDNPSGRVGVDPKYSAAYWRRRAEDHKRVVALRNGGSSATPSVHSGAASHRSLSNEPFGHDETDGGSVTPAASTPATTARRRPAPAVPGTTRPTTPAGRGATSSASPSARQPVGRVRSTTNTTPLVSARMPSRTPSVTSVGSNEPYGAAAGRRPIAGARASTPPTRPAASSSATRSSVAATARTGTPPKRPTTAATGTAARTTRTGTISTAARSTTPETRRLSPGPMPRPTHSSELLRTRGRSPTARDPNSSAAGTRATRDTSTGSVRSALSTSRVSNTTSTTVRPPLRVAGTIPAVGSSVERRPAPQKPRLTTPEPYGRPPAARPAPGSLRIRTPSPSSALVRSLPKDSPLSQSHKAHLGEVKSRLTTSTNGGTTRPATGRSTPTSSPRPPLRVGALSGRSTPQPTPQQTARSTAGIASGRLSPAQGVASGRATPVALRLARVPPPQAGDTPPQEEKPPLRPRV